MKQDLQTYLQSMRGKRVAVVGVGISNLPLIELLRKADIEVTACDKRSRETFGARADQLEKLGVALRLGPGYLDGLDHDIIFRTPGLHPDTPQLRAAREKGAVVTSEMEAFFAVCPCRIIAVTGSDGKTTTTTLISELLKAQGIRCHLGGNIGRPLLADAPGMRPGDYAVLELSSFQLMTMKQSPDVAVITNVAPNHLDVHASMEEYIGAKENIFRFQDQNGKLVLNFDNEITRAMVKKANGRVFGFSCREKPARGTLLSGDSIVLNDGGRSETVLDIKDILIPGRHNVENYMAAICAVSGMVSADCIQKVAKAFPGVEHRLEFVREKDGVKFYNGSIDSSPTRTAAALHSFPQRTIVICGGYDKKIPFEPLGEVLVEKARAVVLVGATSDKIEKAVRSTPGYDENALTIYRCETFAQAVRTAADIARSGDIVILSPACASFDLFSNFEERGRVYKELVRAL